MVEPISTLNGNPLAWIIFNALVLLFLALDLGVFHRHPSTPTYKESLCWSVFWIILACLFGAWLYHDQGKVFAIFFFTGYAIEKTLSMDNIMVFAMIFHALSIPTKYQHRVLFWGILGALVMRALMIFIGAVLISEFHFIVYIFGGFLILTGLKMLYMGNSQTKIQDTVIWRWIENNLSTTKDIQGQKFFIRCKETGKRLATPLFVALILVEFTDIVFAVDSIPAIFAVTKEPFIVYTANVFAILGLRSLYFLMAPAMEQFPYLKTGLALILCFVGFKMVGLVKIDPALSLGIVLTTILASILLSRIKAKTSS
jgi:tellurite resistance protein TerC